MSDLVGRRVRIYMSDPRNDFGVWSERLVQAVDAFGITIQPDYDERNHQFVPWVQIKHVDWADPLDPARFTPERTGMGDGAEVPDVD